MEMGNKDEKELKSFHDRLEFLFKDRSRNAFAKMHGIGDSTFRSYFEGSMPSLDKAAIIAEGAEVSLIWLATGNGPMRPTGVVPQRMLNEQAKFASDLAMIPYLDIQAAAGSGMLNHHEETIGFLAFQASWLSRRGINPQNARVLTAKGDSMEPTIRDGDVLLVDTSIDNVINHGIYVLVYVGMLLVKRLSKKLDGSIIMRSDNRETYDDEVIPFASLAEVFIAGRVMWFGRTI
jgi:phage repressor protein C with HTH and peptisase S24 domain